MPYEYLPSVPASNTVIQKGIISYKTMNSFFTYINDDKPYKSQNDVCIIIILCSEEKKYATSIVFEDCRLLGCDAMWLL
jgi:hypothetical protein